VTQIISFVLIPLFVYFLVKAVLQPLLAERSLHGWYYCVSFELAS